MQVVESGENTRLVGVGGDEEDAQWAAGFRLGLPHKQGGDAQLGYLEREWRQASV